MFEDGRQGVTLGMIKCITQVQDMEFSGADGGGIVMDQKPALAVAENSRTTVSSVDVSSCICITVAMTIVLQWLTLVTFN